MVWDVYSTCHELKDGTGWVSLVYIQKPGNVDTQTLRVELLSDFPVETEYQLKDALAKGEMAERYAERGETLSQVIVRRSEGMLKREDLDFDPDKGHFHGWWTHELTEDQAREFARYWSFEPSVIEPDGVLLTSMEWILGHPDHPEALNKMAALLTDARIKLERAEREADDARSRIVVGQAWLDSRKTQE